MNDDVLELDCGRSAIQYIVCINEYKRVWLPVYNCPSVYKRLLNGCTAELCTYNIDTQFMPEIKKEDFKKGDLLVWINYWGCMKNSVIQNIVSFQNKYDVDVLLDNSVAFFAKPVQDVYNVYSCRKFIGVADGAYIKGRSIEKKTLSKIDVADKYIYLLKAVEHGSNYAYADYLCNEEEFNNRLVPYGMSELTHIMLSTIDYEVIKNKRRVNFEVLHKKLCKKNQLDINYETETPFTYPFLCNSENLRQYLINNKIFVSRHWKHVLDEDISNDFERKLAKYVIPLPIDQRYEIEHMNELADIILEFVE